MTKIKINSFAWYEKPIKWFMGIFGWEGYTAPTKTIYFTVNPSDRLLRHEKMHVKQMEKDGIIRYHIKWFYEFIAGLFSGKSIKESYLDISYEIEARAAEIEKEKE